MCVGGGQQKRERRGDEKPRGCDGACWMDVEKRIRTKKATAVEESHLMRQVDTQTLILLPTVPKLTKRGQPGANSCPDEGSLCRA